MHKLSLAAIVALCLLIVGCASCKNEAQVEHFAPDGRWKYVSFDRNCGATTANNFQVSILEAPDVLPDSAANTFIADDNHGATKFVAQPAWLSSRILEITYSSRAHVFKKESHVGPIEIRYIEQP
jgi:hypothetical protein